MKITFLAIATAVASLLCTLPAAAQFRNADAAIKYRQSVMSVQGFHLGRIFSMANGRIPFDAKVAAEDAQVLDTIDHLPWIAFGEGTDKGTRSTTRAKPEIWSERAKFDAAAVKLVEDVAKLNAAAKTGNLDQIKAAVGVVGKSCDACHDNYQSK